MSLRVGPARPDELPEILALERAAFGAHAWTEAMLSGALRAAPDLFLVAREGERLVGHAIGQLAGDVGEVLELATAPQARRRGVGSALLEALEGALRAGGAVELWLELRADNAAAMALYLRHGYAVTGRRPRYYADGMDAVLMGRG